jgi:hypothetical protein
MLTPRPPQPRLVNVDSLLLVAAVGLATVTGLVGGGGVVIGAIELATGRILINIRQLPWSRHDAQVIGVCRVVQGIVIAVEGAMVAVMTGTELSAGTEVLIPVLMLVNAIMLVALGIPAVVQVRMTRRTGRPLF